MSFTWPMGMCVSCWVDAGVTERLEHILPPGLVVPPPSGLEDKGAFGAVRNDEAVHYMMDLAPITTTLKHHII